MTFLRFVLRAVAICARVAVSACALVSVPAVGKRSRRRLRRGVAVCACLAAVASGLVAPPAAPAQAAPASRAALAAQVARALSVLPSARSQMSVIYPGGDLVTSIQDDGEDPSLVNSFFTTSWPQQVGLPAGSSLSDLIQATYNLTANWAPGDLTPPPTFSGGSYSVSGTTITIDIPAADFQGQTDSWVIGLLAALAGVFAYVAAWGLCMIFTSAPVPLWATVLCNFVGTFFWTLAAYVVGQRLSQDSGGTLFDSQFWKKAITASLVAAAGFAVFGFAAPYLTKILPGVALKIGQKLAQWAKSFLGFLGNKLADLIDWMLSFFEGGAAETAADVELTARSIGAPAQVADGTVTNGALGKCMDAYGSNGGALDNQLVAINDCNGNPAQDWTYYSNNSLSVWGRCLSIVGSGTTGGPAGPGLPVVLFYCQGAAGQEWRQVGNSLVNPASGLCLDDPNFSTTNGTSLQVETCNGSPAQQWSLPGATIPPSSGGPCDWYAFYQTPCVAAYSMVRALYSRYSGSLYQVQRASDGATANIGLQSPGSYANAASQDSFCAGTTCTITRLYDQSPQGNNLTIAAGDNGANAAALPITIHGNKAYGLDIEQGTGYRNNSTRGVATGGAPEGMYMVASGTHVNSGCCFDFGNMETPAADNGAGHMDAVNLSTRCEPETAPCTGGGPWVEADLENGLFTGNGPNPGNLGNSTSFVTALLKNDGQANFALKGGDSTTGGLSTWWNGSLPTGYAPMHQEGGIGLGTGGDNSNRGVGSFFEGVMTAGYPSDTADDAVQANIVAAGYAGNSGGPPNGGGVGAPAGTITIPSGQCVDVQGDDTGGNLTPVVIWNCQSNAVDQHWTHNANGSLETLGRCLSISTATGVAGTGTGVAGNHTVLFDCNDSGVEQWVQQPDGTLRNPPSGLCLYGQPSNGYQLQVVSCNSGDPNQQFMVNGGSPVTNPPSGKCVDVQGDDNGGNLSPVELWDCEQNAADQHWVYNASTKTLKTLGRCLSVSTAIGVGGAGTAVAGNHTVLFDCNGSGVEQWVQQTDGQLINPPSGLCLDDLGNTTNGWQLQVQPCAGANDPGQEFSVYNATGSSSLTGAAGTITLPGGQCVDVLGSDNGGNLAPVDVWGCDPGAVDQHWTHNADGSLETMGLCLSVSTGPGVAGTGTAEVGDHTTLGYCNGSAVEEWVQQPDGTLINPGSGLCLDDPAGNTTNGWQLQVSRCMNGDPTEHFTVNGGNPVRDANSGKCFDVQGDDNGSNLTPVLVWDCQPQAADQHWVFHSASKTLTTLGRCLNISVAAGVGGTGTAAPGDHLTLFDCNGSGVEQWVPRPDGTLLNPASGLCLDDAGGGSTNGTQLQVNQCITGDPTQQFEAYDTGRNLTFPVFSKCVDVQGDDTAGNLAPVQIWDCQPEAADQHWIYTSDGELETLGRCLSVSTAQGVGGTGTAVAGNRTVLFDCNGSGVEHWVPTEAGTWVNPESGLCLDDPNGSSANGNQLEAWTCNGSQSQVYVMR